MRFADLRKEFDCGEIVGSSRALFDALRDFDAVAFSVSFENDYLLGVNFAHANLLNVHFVNSYLNGANFANTDLSTVVWANTVCPDGTNSDTNGSTCVGHT